MAASGDNCTNDIPSSEDLFRYVRADVGFIILVAMCAVLTIIIIGIYIEEIFCILRAEVKDGKERRRLIWIFGLYPVIATTSLISVCVPRSSVLNDLVAALYLSMYIIQFMKIIISYFGGRDRMISALANEKLKLQNPPCCCCVCCPELPVNKRNLMKMYYMVLQVTIIRPLLFYCTSVYLADLGTESMAGEEVTSVVFVLHMASTLTAMYGIEIVFEASRNHLEIFDIRRKALMLQLVLIFVNFQNSLFNWYAGLGVFPCAFLGFPSKAEGSNLHHTVLIFEMFLLTILARVSFHTKEPLSLLQSYIDAVENEASPTETFSGTPSTTYVTDTILSRLDVEPLKYSVYVNQPSGEQTMTYLGKF